MKKQIVTGDYNLSGYNVCLGDECIYWAGNHAKDSQQHAPAGADALPLRTIRSFCIKSTRELAAQHKAEYGGVTRIEDE